MKFQTDTPTSIWEHGPAWGDCDVEHLRGNAGKENRRRLKTRPRNLVVTKETSHELVASALRANIPMIFK